MTLTGHEFYLRSNMHLETVKIREKGTKKRLRNRLLEAEIPQNQAPWKGD